MANVCVILSNDDGDVRDDALQKMKLYFTREIRNCVDLFSMPMALKGTRAKYAMALFNSKWNT